MAYLGKKPAFPPPQHDHGDCEAALLARAEARCRADGARLTPGRRRVLEAIAGSHRAIGAYDIIEEIASTGPRPAPITVYRALDFLVSAALIHRLESRNAYVACTGGHETGGHEDEVPAVLFICKACGAVGEAAGGEVLDAISSCGSALGFAVHAPMVEVEGRCRHCRGG